MDNLWENSNLKSDILNLYFQKQRTIKQITNIVSKKYNLKLSNTKIKKDIGRIIHRRSEDLKLNRKDKSIGKCPVCGKDVFLRDRTKKNEKFTCMCEGVYENKCYFRINKKAYGMVLYNSLIEELLQNGETQNMQNLEENNQKVQGKLKLNLEKRGFIELVKC